MSTTPAPTASAISDEQVDAYLNAQRKTVEEADRFGRPNVGGLHTNTVREACRNGLAAVLALQPAMSGAVPAGIVLVSRDLLIAACSAIDKKRDAPNILGKMRTIAYAAPAAPIEAAQPRDDDFECACGYGGCPPGCGCRHPDAIKRDRDAAQPASSSRPSKEWYAAKIAETLDDDFTIGPASSSAPAHVETWAGTVDAILYQCDRGNVSLPWLIDCLRGLKERLGSSAPAVGSVETERCPACDDGTMIVMSDGGPDAYDVSVPCAHCNGKETLYAAYQGVCEQLGAVERKYQHASAILWLGRANPTAAKRLAELAEYVAQPGMQVAWLRARLLDLADMASVAAPSMAQDAAQAVDAARYRWLRDETRDDVRGVGELYAVRHPRPFSDEAEKDLFGDDLDRAIDAARTPKEPGCDLQAGTVGGDAHVKQERGSGR